MSATYRRVETAIIALLVAVMATLATIALTVPSHDDQPKRPTNITEDDPRWDCHTMGNRICGPGH